MHSLWVVIPSSPVFLYIVLNEEQISTLTEASFIYIVRQTSRDDSVVLAARRPYSSRIAAAVTIRVDSNCSPMSIVPSNCCHWSAKTFWDVMVRLDMFESTMLIYRLRERSVRVYASVSRRIDVPATHSIWINRVLHLPFVFVPTSNSRRRWRIPWRSRIWTIVRSSIWDRIRDYDLNNRRWCY